MMEKNAKIYVDLLLATDPDCDRVGIAVKNKAGEYELLTGNQTGMLLLDYICSQRIKHGKSDVLKFLLENNCSLVVRPSGTEPKLKIYISVSAENKEMAEEVEDEIAKTAEKWIC